MPPLPHFDDIIPSENTNGKRTGGYILGKMGRPKAEKPKDIKYSIRIDLETEQKLEAYCEKNGISKGEAFRMGVKLLIGESEQ